ncbi:MAG: glycosyltransferase, partial [Nitrososphaera sp.]|nr:glycosyltransferase [Nitrososphaera sp.]
MFGNISSWRRGLLALTTARTLYHNLPLKYTHKRRLKNYVYRFIRLIDRILASLEKWRVSKSDDWAGRITPASFQQPEKSSIEAESPIFRPTESGRVNRCTGELIQRRGGGGSPDVGQGPEVSIVIPVFNHLDFTLHCLQSIADTPTQFVFEVIIVDDASTDETGVALSVRDDIRYIRNEENKGFIISCNRGAAEAKGKYLVFLNNDTKVVPGWLDELVRTFANFDNVGLVGSKLVYPNGRLQEAGAIVWNDGSGWNYGRDDDPDRPEYNYLREVDYVSGASIMVPKALFDQVGGFDERYTPAYYEDTDLAFKIRQFGLKVLYQPLSRVIHFEGISSGTDITAGVKSYQAMNTQKFRERWQEVLNFHGNHGERSNMERDRYVGCRALLIDSHTPTPDRDSGSIDTFEFIKILQSLSYKVTFAPHDLAFHNCYTENLQRRGVECLYSPYTKSIESHLKKSGKQYDIIVLFRLDNAAHYMDHVRKHCPNVKIIFDTVDVHHLRERRRAERKNSPRLHHDAAETEQIELNLMEKVDATIVLSSTEYSMLAKATIGAKLFLIPFFRDVLGRTSDYDNRQDILFLGGFKHQPNIDAVQFFVREIFPLIKGQVPGIKFFIVGSDPTSAVLALASDDVIVTGYVEDLSEYMDHCRLTVAPLR